MTASTTSKRERAAIPALEMLVIMTSSQALKCRSEPNSMSGFRTRSTRRPRRSRTASPPRRWLTYVEETPLSVPAGSVVRGYVSAVQPAGHIDRTGSMTVSFDQITFDGRTYPIRGTVTKAIDAGAGSEVGKIGAGAGVGAILGGILGGRSRGAGRHSHRRRRRRRRHRRRRCRTAGWNSASSAARFRPGAALTVAGSRTRSFVLDERAWPSPR